tara:strand:+ start:164 stop:283 length:120 start_codon:yes stop_codon:yes gene_type:complete
VRISGGKEGSEKLEVIKLRAIISWPYTKSGWANQADFFI